MYRSICVRRTSRSRFSISTSSGWKSGSLFPLRIFPTAAWHQFATQRLAPPIIPHRPHRAVIGSEVFHYYRNADLSTTQPLAVSPWKDVEKYPWVAGGLVWSACDYLGEAATHWPAFGWTGAPILQDSSNTEPCICAVSGQKNPWCIP